MSPCPVSHGHDHRLLALSALPPRRSAPRRFKIGSSGACCQSNHCKYICPGASTTAPQTFKVPQTEPQTDEVPRTEPQTDEVPRTGEVDAEETSLAPGGEQTPTLPPTKYDPCLDKSDGDLCTRCGAT